MADLAEAGAIILAGGKSTRMGQDKRFLPIHNRTMIEHIYQQLRPRFKQILISSNDKDKFDFIDTRVIEDNLPNCGPLMGIASALEVSLYDLNAVVACDIPNIDIDFLLNMLKQCGEYDAVVPIKQNFYEPLFAVYRKTMLQNMKKLLSSGVYKIIEVFKMNKIKFVDFDNSDKYCNLNTWQEYQNYIEKIRNKNEITS